MKNLRSILLEADWITKNSPDRNALAQARRERRKELQRYSKMSVTAKALKGVENRRALARAGWMFENGKLKERKAPDYEYASQSVDKKGNVRKIARTSGQTDWYKQRMKDEIRMAQAMQTKPIATSKPEAGERRTIDVKPQPHQPAREKQFRTRWDHVVGNTDPLPDGKPGQMWSTEKGWISRDEADADLERFRKEHKRKTGKKPAARKAVDKKKPALKKRAKKLTKA